MATIKHQFTFRYDSASALQEENPVLEDGRVGIEYDTRLFKIGDGTTAWRQLPYAIINNTQSVFMDISKESNNALKISPEDGGLTVPVSVFGINQMFNEGVQYAESVASISEEKKQSIRDEHNQSEHHVTAFLLGWVIKRLIMIIGGDSLAQMLATSNTQHPSNPQGQTLSLKDLVKPIIEEYNQVNSLGAQIKDSATETTSVWSSKKISDTIRTSIASLVNSAPEALDTINELASALISNRDNIGVLTDAIADSVKTSEQALDEAKQKIARDNIKAVGIDVIGSASNAQPESVAGGVTESFFPMVYQNLNKSISERTWEMPPFC